MGANNVSAAADVDHNRCEINSFCKIIAVLRFAGVFATTSNICRSESISGQTSRHGDCPQPYCFKNFYFYFLFF
jgi:hypothetical protein